MPRPVDPSFVPEVDRIFVRDSVATLLRLFPSLGSVELLRSWVRFEAVTPDDRFVAGAAGPRGLFIAAGDGGTGFIRAPALGRLITDAIDERPTPFPVDLYRPVAFRGRGMSSVVIWIDGEQASVPSGVPLGAVLHRLRHGQLRRTARLEDARGLFCGMGTCFDCLVTIDGRPGQRACITPVENGMRVEDAGGGATRMMTSASFDVAVIGGGPAGLAAAAAAARSGARVALVDMGMRPGGQYWMRETPHLRAHAGPQSRAGVAMTDAVQVLGVTIYSQAEVWAVFPGFKICATQPAGALDIAAKALVIAAGAHDRVLPFPGWTLPGVMTPGAGQRLVKLGATPPGDRIVLAGSGPFLLAVAGHAAHPGPSARHAGGSPATDACGGAALGAVSRPLGR